ncbi:hypothetical protein Bbelb_302630 [Branchiostoma belcheri]|nr:hypothetical protein Bbelb_302630 [Branchiostoma belcheri]
MRAHEADDNIRIFSQTKGYQRIRSGFNSFWSMTKKLGNSLKKASVYAPTEVSEVTEKEFYAQLESVVSQVPGHDTTFLMGDFNAQVGSDNTGFSSVMGTEGTGTCNDNVDWAVKFKQQKRKQAIKRYNLDKLKSDSVLQKAYQAELKDSFSRLDPTASVEEVYTQYSTVVNTFAAKNLDKLKPATRPWIQQDTWVAIEERGALKQIACSRNTRGNRQRLATQAKKEAEKAAAEGNTHVVFEKIRVLSGGNKKTQMQPVKDTNGHLLTDEYSQSKRWAEHFSSVYNRPIPDNPPEIPPAESDLLINVDQFITEEVTKAVGKLKLRKSPGEDSITAEQLKAGDTASIEWLHLICNMVLETGEVPTAWKRAVIVKLPKKGDLTICDNWRGIALLSVPGKVLSNLLLNRIKSSVDEVMREERKRRCPLAVVWPVLAEGRCMYTEKEEDICPLNSFNLTTKCKHCRRRH